MLKVSCVGILGFILGHKYKPSLTRSEPIVPSGSRFPSYEIDSFRREAFHGIYCKRCGDFIKNE